jgi:hypothetical protein
LDLEIAGVGRIPSQSTRSKMVRHGRRGHRHLSGDPPSTDAIPASPAIKVVALNQTFCVVIGLIAIALLLSLCALRQERRLRNGP